MNYLEEVLTELCVRLQLQPSAYKLAEERYEHISELLAEDDKFKYINLSIYSQGSFRLKTTVKPIGGNEFDLDFVCQVDEQEGITPGELYDNIYDVLWEDKRYRNKIQKKNRCIRINYANDFHMDIMPGCKSGMSGTDIIVPDRELKEWKPSNPIAYAEWFERNARTTIQKHLYSSTEKLPEQEQAKRLEPLRKATQLIKRYRDIYCSENKKEPTRSIVLCTLLGYTTSGYSDTMTIIEDFCSYVNRLLAESKYTRFKVRNPVIKDELLSEKWEEDYSNYYDFQNMMAALTDDIRVLKQVDSRTKNMI